MRQLTSELTTHVHLEAAEAIFNGLPTPNAANRQVTYADEHQERLIAAMAEGLTTPGVTSLEHVRALTGRLGKVVTERQGFVVIGGDCRERIYGLDTPISHLVGRIATTVDAVRQSDIKDVEVLARAGGQYVKPRSNPLEVLVDKDGDPVMGENGLPVLVMSYQGDLIHGESQDNRQPHPDNYVAGLSQARDLREAADLILGEHLPFVHEALAMHYEEPQLREDPDTGEEYSVAGDGLWGGVRTNDPNNPIIKFLGRLLNTTGSKIDGTSTPGHIADLEAVLNPHGIPGKSMYMLRPERKHRDNLPSILQAIKDKAPLSVVLFDVHGSTETLADGTKVRHVGRIEEDMEFLAHACMQAGVYFAGLSLETIPDLGRLECIDEYGQTPQPGGIDPGLNPRQTLRVANKAAVLQRQQVEHIKRNQHLYRIKT